MIIRARSVVTMDGEPIANGAVAVSGDTISDVGGWAEVCSRNAGEVLDLGESVLMPGLINAHCHLDYTNLRGAIPPTASFTDWIRAINSRKAGLSPQDYLDSIADGLAEAGRFGTTTIANLEAFPELLASMASPPAMRVWWLAEMIDVRERQSAGEVYERLGSIFSEADGWLGGIGLAPHAPFTASSKLYADASSTAVRYDMRLTTHLAESREEMAMFRDGSGPLFDFMKNIGRPMDDCGTATPIALLLQQGLLDDRWIVAHLNEVTPNDFDLLEGAPKFHVVHCPRSHAYFGHSPFPLKEFRRLGFNVCLGTDSLASNSDLSLFAEMRQLSERELTLAARELLEMVTVNAAAALGQSEALGRLRPGFKADLIALPSSKTENPLDEIIQFRDAVQWTMLNGQVLRFT